MYINRQTEQTDLNEHSNSVTKLCTISSVVHKKTNPKKV